MLTEHISITFMFGACIWGVLSIIWILGMHKDTKARWMHQLHAILPLVVIGCYVLIGNDAVLRRVTGQWLAAGVSILAILTLVWLFTLISRNAGVMDVVYTLTVLIAAGVLLASDASYSTRHLVIMALVAVWSARSVRHVSGSNLGSSGEQQPYAKWRIQFGSNWWWRSYFQVFLLQGGLLWIWALPLVMAVTSSGPMGARDLVATAIWIVGFIFQAGADWQLKQFKAIPSNKGKVLQSGLWSLSRHPNYFGEALIWWAYFVFGLAHPYGWIGIIGPIYVTWFMSKGSAGPMMDRHMLRTKIDYAQYVARVPGFAPFLKSPADAALLERYQHKRSS